MIALAIVALVVIVIVVVMMSGDDSGTSETPDPGVTTMWLEQGFRYLS